MCKSKIYISSAGNRFYIGMKAIRFRKLCYKIVGTFMLCHIRCLPNAVKNWRSNGLISLGNDWKFSTSVVFDGTWKSTFLSPCRSASPRQPLFFHGLWMAAKLVEKNVAAFKNLHFTTSWILNFEQMIITMMTTMMMVIGDNNNSDGNDAVAATFTTTNIIN